MPLLKEAPSAEPFVPKTTSLSVLSQAAQRCRGCNLYRDATQAVFGEGPATAKVVVVGEQPGDQEDRKGKPFVGPAGRLLDKALVEAGVDRSQVYVTNAVKHFRFEEVGGRRKHKKPSARQIQACWPWLEAELHRIRPEVVVALGATAAESLVKRPISVLRERGHVIEHTPSGSVLITVHPSSILRVIREPELYAEQFQQLVSDLRKLTPYL